MRFPVLSVVIPVYNEVASLRELLEEGIGFLDRHVEQFELIFVDDGSTDGTLGVLHERAQRCSHLRILTHAQNQGYGACLREGFAVSRHPWVFYTASDFQYRLEGLLAFFPLTPQADLVAGYRIRRRDSFPRRFLSAGYHRLAERFFGIRVQDVNCAFKLIRKNVLEDLKIESDRFFVDTELLWKARRRGWRILEAGVEHYPRRFGRSKVRGLEVIRTLREAIRIGREWRRESTCA